jgi:phage tail-like protein
MTKKNKYMLHISGPTGEEVVALADGVSLLGRTNADIILDLPVVSRRHAEFNCDDDGCTITDLASSNGTSVNGVNLTANKPLQLKDGDVIEIGPFTLRYEQIEKAPPIEKTHLEEVIVDEVVIAEAHPAEREEMDEIIPPPPPPPPALSSNGYVPAYQPPPGQSLTDSRYLQYLPDIYHTKFMGRFLAMFESIYGPIESTVDNFDLFLNPGTAPDGFLPWLANWFDLTAEKSWGVDKQRQLLLDARKLYDRRGTKWAVGRILEIYTGQTPEIDDTSEELEPFTFTVTLPMSAESVNQAIVEQLIIKHKPAHTNFTLKFTNEA